jgi:hypothetical protein
MEIAMKAWKWTTLVLSGGVLLQFSACASDFGYYVMQALATQIVTALASAATGTTA